MTYNCKTTAVIFALLGSAACAANPGSTEEANAGEREPRAGHSGEAPAGRLNGLTRMTDGAADEQAPRPATEGSVMAWSRPAARSTVNAPVDELVFGFSPPARLDEVTVNGPEGAMATMATAVGEMEHYSVPVSGLKAGHYTVDWRATARGVVHKGSFGFEVG